MNVFLDIATTSDEHAEESRLRQKLCSRNVTRMSTSELREMARGKIILTFLRLPSLPQPDIVCQGHALGVKRPGREADHSPAPTTDVNKEWRYKFTPRI
jgi:hypothetical protein